MVVGELSKISCIRRWNSGGRDMIQQFRLLHVKYRQPLGYMGVGKTTEKGQSDSNICMKL